MISAEQKEQIEQYGIDHNTEEGFRERLAYGAAPVITEHAVVPRGYKPPQVCIDGEWVAL
jgi:hypothetical protein